MRGTGTTGACEHDPPRSLDLPIGDIPLRGGRALGTEIGGLVDRSIAGGRLPWSIRMPADARLLPDGNVLVAGHNQLGKFHVINPRDDRIFWSYGPTLGRGSLNYPSFAVMLPNGTIAATDDKYDRVANIDRVSRRIIWQYGHRGAPGYLNTPDGLDLVR